jgi:hypothetical protein
VDEGAGNKSEGEKRQQSERGEREKKQVDRERKERRKERSTKKGRETEMIISKTEITEGIQTTDRTTQN